METLGISGGTTHLPRIWSDIVIFDQTHREKLLTLTLNVMREQFPSDAESNLAQKFGEIGSEIWKIVESQDPERIKFVQWTGKMIGDLLAIQLKVNNLEMASDIVLKLLKSQQGEVLGVPDIQSLTTFLHMAIEKNKAAMALVWFHQLNVFAHIQFT